MIKAQIYINTQIKDPVTGLVIDNWLLADTSDKVQIVLKDSIKKAKDVGKVFTTYTNPFTLPASKQNNKIFKRFSSNKVYEGFDPRRKYEARIQLNGADFKKGYIKLNVVDMKDNLPFSYSIQFFGELASVKDILSDGNLNKLNNLNSFTFPYTTDNVKLGFEEGFNVEVNVDAGIPANFRLELTNGVETAGDVKLTLDDIQYTIPVPAGGPAYVTTAIFNYMFQIPNLGWNFFKESYNGYMNAINFTNGTNGWSPDLLFDTNNVDYLTANVQIITNGNSDPTEADVTIIPSTKGTFKFPMLSHTRGFEYSDDDGFHLIQSNAEISSDEGIPTIARLNKYDLKPAIRVESLFDGIEATYPIVFNKDWMFGTDNNQTNASPISDMYMWLHNKKGYAGYLTADGDPLEYTHDRVIRYDGGTPATGEWQQVSNGYYDIRPFVQPQPATFWRGTLKVSQMAGDGAVSLKVWIMKEEGGVFQIDGQDSLFEGEGQGTEDEIVCDFSFPLNEFPDAGQWEGQGYYIRTLITCDTSIIEFTPEVIVEKHFINADNNYLPDKDINIYSDSNEFQPNSVKIIKNINAAGLMPDYKCIDFLSDLFKLYNLVAYEEIQPDQSYKINVESYDYYMSKGSKYDITQYIDISKSTVERISPFSIVNYSFEEPKSFLAINQSDNTGDSWGNVSFNVSNFSEGQNSTNSLLFDGGEYKVEPKLEKVMYDRILSRPQKRKTPIQWGWMVGDQTTNLPEPVKGKPQYMFINRKRIGGSPLSSENQFTIQWDEYDTYSEWMNIPSNVNDAGTQTLHFNSEFDEYFPEQGTNPNSLFKNYHKNFIDNIYSEYSKKVKVKAFLPPLIFTKLKLNDTIIVDNTDYFIDEMDVNITTSEVKFSLLRVTNIITRISGRDADNVQFEKDNIKWEEEKKLWNESGKQTTITPFERRVYDDGGKVESIECIDSLGLKYYNMDYFYRVAADGGIVESLECVNA
jgi:hypothetical protein